MNESRGNAPMLTLFRLERREHENERVLTTTKKFETCSTHENMKKIPKNTRTWRTRAKISNTRTSTEMKEQTEKHENMENTL